jgi:hypothetical protein
MILTEDEQLASRYGLTFKVMRKAGRGQQWEMVEPSLNSLFDAVEKARQIDAWEAAVYTSEGYQYWSSRAPDYFNSSVVRQGKMTVRTLPEFESIQWRVLLRARSERKVDLFLQRVGAALGREVTRERCERYWKDRRLFDLHFSSPLHEPDIRSAVFQALLHCQALMPHWTVTGPTQYEGGHWEFQGSSVNEVTGIVMIEFWTANFVQEWSGHLAEKTE